MSFHLRKIWFLILYFLFSTTNIYAVSFPNGLPELIYYDANSIEIKQNLNVYELNGDAAFMMGELFLSADKITIQKEEKFITAEGHVKVIYKKTQALASKILYDGNTKQLRMDNAKIYSDPKSQDNLFAQEALGFSKSEVAFELARQSREQEILKELKNTRIAYANLRNLASLKKDDKNIQKQIEKLKNTYGQLLERYMRISSQYNTNFNALSERDKTKYAQRRAAIEKFNREYPNMAEKILNFSTMPTYIYVAASQIIQKDDETYLLNSTFITPCNCGTSSVPPIFGFSAQKAKIELGNYVTMEGSTFDIFRVPVFYLPWSRLSIKTKRETGFLYPGGYASNNAGFAVSFPFFLTLGEHADSTTTYQYFSLRGSRISESVRFAFWEESTLSLAGNTAFDRLYPVQWATNKQNVENALADPDLTPEQKEGLTNFIGKDLNLRWYAETSWNIPVFDFASVKLNGQITSDNTYISDYESSTKIDPLSTVYGNTTPASRRFLNQEVDAEYYGNHVVFSARNTRYQDLFALTQNDSPVSLPLMEFTLLPANYLPLPITIANKSTFEDIIGSQTIKGKRFASSSYFRLNLPYNSYINSYLQLQETAVQYYSPSGLAASHDNTNPAEIYSRFSLRTEIPFYTTSTYKNKKTASEIIIKNNFKPFADLSYIPTVNRSASFPYTYQLWYADDNVAKSALISVGSSWSLNIKRTSNSTQANNARKIRDSKIANMEILAAVIKAKRPNASAADEMYILPTDTEATQIYTQWSELELDRFYDEVLKSEFNKTDLLPNVDEKSDFDFTPLRFQVFTNYNLMADETAKELNKIAGPLFTPVYIPERLGDITAELDWNLLPFVGWDGAVIYSYSQAYKWLNTLTASSNIAFGYGVAGMARYQIQRIVDSGAPDLFIKKTFLNFGLSYTPKPFVKVGFEWAKNTDPTLAPTTDLSEGRKYGSSIYVNFLNLQDCMDITIARNKPAGVPESQATYAIGINIKFFGHQVGYNQIGNWINKLIQN